MKQLFLLVLILTCSLTGLLQLNGQTLKIADKQKQLMVKKVLSDKGVPVRAGNLPDCALTVQEASVKELNESDFAMLTGETSSYGKRSTFPQVTLFNNSDKAIKTIAVAIENSNSQTGSNFILFKNGLSIPPRSTYQIDPSEWPKAETITIEENGHFSSGLRQPALDSSKAWIKGSADDLIITVGYIEFSDNNRWIIPEDVNLSELVAPKTDMALLTQKGLTNNRFKATVGNGLIKPASATMALVGCTCACAKNCDGTCVGETSRYCTLYGGVVCVANCCQAAPTPTQAECAISGSIS